MANMSASFEWTWSRREGRELDASWALPIPISLHTTFGCDLELEEETYELGGGGIRQENY